MIYKSLSFKTLFLLLSFSLPITLTANPSPEAGKTIFNNYCATCHAKDMKSALTGPGLGGTEERWADFDRADLYTWIRNSSALINSGHPRAVELWNEYKPTVMTAFPNLTDDDIESVLAYIQCRYDGSCGPKPTENGGPGGGVVTESTPKYLYWLLLAILAILAIVLARIISNLNQIAAEREGRTVRRKTIMESLAGTSIVGFLIFALIVLAGYKTVNNAVNLGRQQGYAPEQPIKFSHETHAGVHKIDCQYCHDGARRSKHAIIPSSSTCMNCHSAIKYGSEHGTAELTKIYASIGYDPSGAGQYIENYESLPRDSIKAIFTKWIADQYLVAKGLETLDERGEELVESEWMGIVNSLTNEQKTKIAGPIEWTRIHNLPDHVYFNHAQHVKVGEVECQQCHGPVEGMDVLEQYSPLSMGWCINCHRQTEVQFEGNAYYESYVKYHEELTKEERESVTVEDIGGLECQKCHY